MSDSIGVVGAGIIGAAVGRQLALTMPGTRVVLLEKERQIARHQTGHNSGVVHAGLYYKPGSLKATLCRRGVGMLREYCTENELAFEPIGKVVVARTREDIQQLKDINKRARSNDVPGLRMIGPSELRDIEPHVIGAGALYSPTTAITDYAAIARCMATEISENAGEVVTGTPIDQIRQDGDGVNVYSGERSWRFRSLIICAGLQSDRMALQAGGIAEPAIVPFRGRYYNLVAKRRHLVRGLVYPVPDPDYPFLGVHLTPDVNGGVLVGPNATLALSREHYLSGMTDIGDLREILGWPGFWHLAGRHWRKGSIEAGLAASRWAFARQARRLVPELTSRDLEAGPVGVRAQALDRKGNLLDDFQLDVLGRVAVLRNAPSPGATSAMAIAEYVVASMN